MARGMRPGGDGLATLAHNEGVFPSRLLPALGFRKIHIWCLTSIMVEVAQSGCKKANARKAQR
ncbi:hypothetical protein ASD46_02720 [Rhizobium sp. Root491]|nr:hypothetical protein ASD46_02720 [Rhizobium sp. Root491]